MPSIACLTTRYYFCREQAPSSVKRRAKYIGQLHDRNRGWSATAPPFLSVKKTLVRTYYEEFFYLRKLAIGAPEREARRASWLRLDPRITAQTYIHDPSSKVARVKKATRKIMKTCTAFGPAYEENGKKEETRRRVQNQDEPRNKENATV